MTDDLDLIWPRFWFAVAEPAGDGRRGGLGTGAGAGLRTKSETLPNRLLLAVTPVETILGCLLGTGRTASIRLRHLPAVRR